MEHGIGKRPDQAWLNKFAERAKEKGLAGDIVGVYQAGVWLGASLTSWGVPEAFQECVCLVFGMACRLRLRKDPNPDWFEIVDRALEWAWFDALDRKVISIE